MELLGVDDVGGGSGVEKDFNDVSVAQANSIGKVVSHSEVGADLYVGVRASISKDAHHSSVLRADCQAEGCLVIQNSIEVGSAFDENLCHIGIASLDRQAQRRFVIKLFSVDDVRVGSRHQQDSDDFPISQPNGVGEVGSYSEVGLTLRGVRAGVGEDLAPL